MGVGYVFGRYAVSGVRETTTLTVSELPIENRWEWFQEVHHVRKSAY